LNILCHPTIVGKGFVAQQAVGFVWVAVEFFPHQRPAFFSNMNVHSIV